MRHRIHNINAPMGWRTLTVSQEITDGKHQFTGYVDGQACVTGLTHEAVVHSLLRRVAQRVLH